MEPQVDITQRFPESRSDGTVLNTMTIQSAVALRLTPSLVERGEREGFKEGFTLGQDLMLVDCTSRTVRDDNVSLAIANGIALPSRPPCGKSSRTIKFPFGKNMPVLSVTQAVPALLQSFHSRWGTYSLQIRFSCDTLGSETQLLPFGNILEYIEWLQLVNLYESVGNLPP